MSSVDATLLYSLMGIVHFGGPKDALNFIYTIKLWTRTRYADYQWMKMAKLSVLTVAQDQFIQSNQLYITTMTQLEFKEQFLRYFCPASMRDNFIWQLLHIVRDDKLVQEYTHEFFRLLHYTVDVILDERRVMDLFVTGQGPTYIGI